jgi:hypothetical protein
VFLLLSENRKSVCHIKEYNLLDPRERDKINCMPFYTYLQIYLYPIVLLSYAVQMCKKINYVACMQKENAKEQRKKDVSAVLRVVLLIFSVDDSFCKLSLSFPLIVSRYFAIRHHHHISMSHKIQQLIINI